MSNIVKRLSKSASELLVAGVSAQDVQAYIEDAFETEAHRVGLLLDRWLTDGNRYLVIGSDDSHPFSGDIGYFSVEVEGEDAISTDEDGNTFVDLDVFDVSIGINLDYSVDIDEDNNTVDIIFDYDNEPELFYTIS